MKRNEIDKDLTWDLSSMFQSQEAYEEAYHTVFNRLDWLEAWLLPHRREKLSENKI